MISRVMRASAVAACFFVLTTFCLLAQASNVPPLPREEQFKRRSDLVASLRLSSDHVPIGRTPGVTLVLTNTGRRPLLIQRGVGFFPAQQVRLFKASGEAVWPRSSNTCMCIILPGSVKDLLTVQPHSSHEFVLWKADEAQPYHLPVGEYRMEFTYRSAPDLNGLFDVYEKGADLAWDGQLVTSVSFQVEALNAEEEARLLAAISDPAQTQNAAAVSRLGLGRVRAATDSLVALFEKLAARTGPNVSIESVARDAFEAGEITEALGYIGTNAAARQLGRALERMPVRSDFFFPLMWNSWSADTVMNLVAATEGCDGLSVVLYGLPSGSSQKVIGALEDRCPRLRQILEEYVASADGERAPRERRMVDSRADRAKQLLRVLDAPSPTIEEPEPIEQERPLDANRLQDYLRTVVSGPYGDDDWEDAERGVILFSSPATYRQLRGDLDTADEKQAAQIGAALALITFRDDVYRPPDAERAYWDDWWKTHERLTRAQWAREILRTHEVLTDRNAFSERSGYARAAAYLMQVDGSERLIRELTQHESWRVRVTAASTLRAGAPRRAGELLIRELRGRYISACSAAIERLQQLTNQRHPTDCLDPSQREEGVVYWTRVVNALPLRATR